VRRFKEFCHNSGTTLVRSRSVVVRNAFTWVEFVLVLGFQLANLVTTRVIADWDRLDSRLACAKHAVVRIPKEIGQVSEVGRVSRVTETIKV